MGNARRVGFLVFIGVAMSLAGASAALGQERAALVLEGTIDAPTELATRDALGRRGLLVLDRQSIDAVLAFAHRPGQPWDEPGAEAVRTAARTEWVVVVESRPGPQGGLAVRVLAGRAGVFRVRFGMAGTQPELPAAAAWLTADALAELASLPPPPASGAGLPGPGAPPPPGPGATTPPGGPVPPAAGGPVDLVPPAATAPGGPPGTSATVTIPGLTPPASKVPIPLADPAQPFKPLDRIQDVVAFPWLLVAANLTPAVLVPTDFSTALYATSARLTLAANITPMIGLGMVTNTTMVESSSATVLGAGVDFLAGAAMLSVGLVGDHGYNISNAASFDLTANMTMWKLAPGISHGLAINFSGTAPYESSSQGTMLFGLGWAVSFGSPLPVLSEVEGYRHKAWEHQRRERGLN